MTTHTYGITSRSLTTHTYSITSRSFKHFGGFVFAACQQEKTMKLVPSMNFEPTEKPTMLAHPRPVVQLNLLLQLESLAQLKQIVQLQSMVLLK